MQFLLVVPTITHSRLLLPETVKAGGNHAQSRRRPLARGEVAGKKSKVEDRGKNMSVGLILVLPSQLFQTVGGEHFFTLP
jgi:hypothetical protein